MTTLSSPSNNPEKANNPENGLRRASSQFSYGQFSYNGEIFAIIKDVIKYAVFILLTVGIYRFWANTHLRQYFWSSARLESSDFSYHGTGKELFYGFLVAILFLFAFNLVDYAFSFVSVFSEIFQFIYSIIVLILFIYFYNFAVYRMIKYRATRTSWRGVRFGMDERGFSYALVASLWGIVNIISLGLFYPMMRTKLITMRIRHIRFGNRFFHSNLKFSDLAKFYYIIWGVAIAIIIAAGLYFISKVTHAEWKDIATGGWKNFPTAFILAVLIPYAILFIAFIGYRFFELCRIINSIEFVTLRLQLDLAVAKYACLWVLLLCGYAVILISLIGVGITFIPIFLPLAFILFIMGFVMLYIYGIFCTNWLLSIIINNMVIKGDMDVLEHVESLRRDDLTRGEGFAQALDIGNF